MPSDMPVARTIGLMDRWSEVAEAVAGTTKTSEKTDAPG